MDTSTAVRLLSLGMACIIAWYSRPSALVAAIGAYILGVISCDTPRVAMEKEYATSVQNMREGAARLIAEYKNPGTTDEKRKKILAKGISFYLAPRSRGELFECSIVIYNGKFKPTIMTADEHREIYLLQLELLQLGGVEETVKKFRIGEDAYAWDQKTYEAALAACGLSAINDK
jgi:hypothetical protein